MTESPSVPPQTPQSTAPEIGDQGAAPDKIGMVGLVLSILGILTCGLWLFSVPGLIISIVATQRRRSPKGLAGVVLGAVGVAAFLLMVPLLAALLLPSTAKAREIAQITKAHAQAIQIHENIVKNSSPEEAALTPTPGPISKATHPDLPTAMHDPDPWGNPYRIEAGPEGNGDTLVTSDGPDGIQGTEDDIRHPAE